MNEYEIEAIQEIKALRSTLDQHKALLDKLRHDVEELKPR